MNNILRKISKPTNLQQKRISDEEDTQQKQPEDDDSKEILDSPLQSSDLNDYEQEHQQYQQEQQQQMTCNDLVTQQQLEAEAEFLNKAKTLQYALETDLLACDAKWTLFVSAVFSYRYDSLLQPFPPQFVSDQLAYDIDSLMSVIKDTPKLNIILQNLIQQSFSEISGEVVDLLYWVLVLMSEPDLCLVEEEELYNLLASIDEKPITLKPTHVFEVKDSLGFHSEVTFRGKAENFPRKLAFMGNKLENYFSLLQNGFAHLRENKNNFLLTTDLQTSLQHSPYCAAWGASQCGSIISATAICEFPINMEEDKIVRNKNDKSCVDIQLSDSQNLRIRYLIFYGRRFPQNLPKKHRISSWLYSHRYSISLITYMLLLLSIGVANSDSCKIAKLYLFKKFDFILEFFRRIIYKDVARQ